MSRVGALALFLAFYVVAPAALLANWLRRALTHKNHVVRERVRDPRSHRSAGT